MNNTSSLFDTFNARNLSFEQVAITFVPNNQFENLIDNNHTLLMGPRGSGKTTLLKMLTPMALDKWTEKGNKNRKTRIPFLGVYIPTDTQFKRQLEYLNGKLDKDDFRLISKTIINTNVLLALAKTLSYISLKENNIEKEVELSIKLIENWRLKRPMAPTLHSIEEALIGRVTEISNITNKIIYYINKGGATIPFPDYFFDEFISLCEYACTAYDIIYSKLENKWALCFDELELAPEWLQTELLGYLRSVSQRFIFKLTTSPVVTLEKYNVSATNIYSATPSNDYRIVRTWPINNSEIKRWNKFCELLITSKLQRRFGGNINPNFIFGDDSLERSTHNTIYDSSKKVEEYSKNSLAWQLIKDYAEIDGALKLFLERKHINPYNPVPISQHEKDTVFRKLKEIIIYRYNYFGNSRQRTRKNPSLHFGVPYIYEICDGNPRQLIGLIDELLSRVSLSLNSIPQPLAINVQSEVISSISSRYLKILSTHPEGNIIVGKKLYSISDFLITVGTYFHERLVEDSFTIDPVGSFIVDKANSQTMYLIQFALAHGAIVYVNPLEGVSNDGIVGKRFRLSYLLTPTFKIPKRNYSPVNLSSILNHKFKSDSSQLNIFSS